MTQNLHYVCLGNITKERNKKEITKKLTISIVLIRMEISKARNIIVSNREKK
jgi:hypothetical protein